MKPNTRIRKGALFLTAIEEGDEDKLIAYRVIYNCVPGIGYMKGDALIAFEPMEAFLRRCYTATALIITDEGAREMTSIAE